MKRAWIAAGIAAIAAVVAAYIALAQNTSSASATTQWTGRTPYWSNATSQTPCPAWGGAKAWRVAHPRGVWGVPWNATAYPPTAKSLTISMSSSQVSLQLQLTGITRGPSGVAQIVAGSGTVKAGDQSYNVVSAYGVVGNGFFALRLYTGNALIAVVYYNGVYRAVVQPLGVAQTTIYYGNATAQIT